MSAIASSHQPYVLKLPVHGPEIRSPVREFLFRYVQGFPKQHRRGRKGKRAPCYCFWTRTKPASSTSRSGFEELTLRETMVTATSPWSALGHNEDMVVEELTEVSASGCRFLEPMAVCALSPVRALDGGTCHGWALAERASRGREVCFGGAPPVLAAINKCLFSIKWGDGGCLSGGYSSGDIKWWEFIHQPFFLWLAWAKFSHQVFNALVIAALPCSSAIRLSERQSLRLYLAVQPTCCLAAWGAVFCPVFGLDWTGDLQSELRFFFFLVFLWHQNIQSVRLLVPLKMDQRVFPDPVRYMGVSENKGTPTGCLSPFSAFKRTTNANTNPYHSSKNHGTRALTQREGYAQT